MDKYIRDEDEEENIKSEINLAVSIPIGDRFISEAEFETEFDSDNMNKNLKKDFNGQNSESDENLYNDINFYWNTYNVDVDLSDL